MAKDPPEPSKPQAVPSSSRHSGRSSPSLSVSQSVPRVESTARLGSPVPSSVQSRAPAVGQIPTPAQLDDVSPVPIQTPLAGRAEAKSSLPGPGTSALSSALKESLGKSPPRFAAASATPQSPAVNAAAAPGRGPPSNFGSYDGRGRSPVPYEDPEIVRRHLVGQYGSPSRSTRGFGGDDESQSRRGDEDEDDEFNSLQLQGGDITRQIYRWSEQQAAEERGKMSRSKSFHASRRNDDNDISASSIRQPGGFRRQYLRKNAPSPSPAPGPSGYGTIGESAQQRPQPFTSNFLEFLNLYGDFAGV